MRRLDTETFRTKGFLLQEVIVGLVIFGIAMYPILRALVLLPRVAALAGVQARAESWRSASDGFVAVGVDAERNQLLPAAAPNLDARNLDLTATRQTLQAQQGASQITVLSEVASNTAEERSRPAGLEIGAALLPEAPRADPLTPLPPIKPKPPILSPTSGTFLNALALQPVAGGYGTALQATAANPIDRVFMQETAPEIQRNSSAGNASLLMTAGALADAYHGTTWAEFAGSDGTDTRVELDDGRARWLVKVGQQIQVYEPSDAVPFVYGVDLGRPVFNFAGAEYPSGSEISVDFVQARSVAAGSSLAVLAYPDQVRERFGTRWTEVEPRFKWTFGGSAGDSSSGNTASIFSDTGRGLWGNSQTLSAEPSSTSDGVRAWTGTWTLVRSALTLGPPERVSVYYDGETDEAGMVDFSAPILSQTGQRVGRPEIDGVESIGTTLSSSLVP